MTLQRGGIRIAISYKIHNRKKNITKEKTTSVRERVLIYSVNPKEDSAQYEYMMWGNLAPDVMCDQCDDLESLV